MGFTALLYTISSFKFVQDMSTSVKTGLGSRKIAAGLDADTPGAFSAIPIVDLQLEEAKVVEQVHTLFVLWCFC